MRQLCRKILLLDRDIANFQCGKCTANLHQFISKSLAMEGEIF